MGFGVPIGTWLRDGLRDWAEALLEESRLRREGYLDPGPIRRCWIEHLSCQRNWQHQLWAIIMFQSWVESRQSPAPARSIRSEENTSALQSLMRTSYAVICLHKKHT